MEKETYPLTWIAINNELPIIPENVPTYEQKVKVLGTWGNKQWAEFDYVRRSVRGKTIDRFEWNGRINTFPLTHWAIPTIPKTTEN
jgi:hypothetical protein